MFRIKLSTKHDALESMPGEVLCARRCLQNLDRFQWEPGACTVHGPPVDMKTITLQSTGLKMSQMVSGLHLPVLRIHKVTFLVRTLHC